MKSIMLYHGGDRELQIENIKFNGRNDCDFGKGFYMTPHKQIAEEWVRKRDNAVINKYELVYEESDSIILKGSDWLKVILGFREGLYPVNLTKNLVIGAIANDRMNSALPAFLTEGILGIGDKRLFECLTLVQLGDQYTLKNSVEGLTFVGSYVLKGFTLQQARDRHSQRRVNMAATLNKIKRNQYTNELFLEDYVEECKNGFTI